MTEIQVLTFDLLLKYKNINTEPLPELQEFFQQSRRGRGWRKDRSESDHWLVNKKFTQTDNEKLYSQFRSILNKLSDSNFNDMARELVEQNIVLHEHLVKLVDFIFQKAIIERKFSEVYAKLARELASYYIIDENQHKIYFRELLFSKCQTMFNDALLASGDTGRCLKTKEQIIGCMIFIGELYLNELLIKKIINGCILNLIMKIPAKQTINGTPYIIDSIVALIKTIGTQFNTQCPDDMDAIFSKLDAVMKSPDIQRKEKFSLMDLMDERKTWEKK